MIDAQIEAPLRLGQPDELMVYLHIPFCSTRCGYCDFYSETDVGELRIAATLKAILREAEWYRAIYPKARFSSLYLGGGTPSLIPSKLLAPFLARLARLFAPATQGSMHSSTDEFEWSFEANPESLDPEKLSVLAESGVNRLSLGVQSFNDRFLRALDRQADSQMVQRALEEIQNNGRFELSLDLMTGLPDQSKDDVAADVQRLLNYRPEHLSLYSLTVERGTPLERRVQEGLVSLGAPSHRDSLWETATALLRRNGYQHYEISNFCLPGKHARHNSGYWQGRPYLGLGPGAVGTLPLAPLGPPGERVPASPPGERAVRIGNPGLREYLQATGVSGGLRPAHQLEYLSGQDLLLERFLLGLRTSGGVRIGACAAEFGVDEAALRTVVESWKGAVYLDRRSFAAGRVALRQGGRMLLDRLLPDLAVRLESLPNESGL
ncbi:MAG: coproporphyrinogen III oxidase family protein [Spirochaetaceae bacterium]|nr:MAG: coproporphyrinogen III oxidase family protein [Spirochaetaceae bacterium]